MYDGEKRLRKMAIKDLTCLLCVYKRVPDGKKHQSPQPAERARGKKNQSDLIRTHFRRILLRWKNNAGGGSKRELVLTHYILET